MLINPDEMVDEHGGVMVPYKTVHKCYKPNPGGNQIRYYRTGCCNEWYYRSYEDWGYEWRKLSKWRAKRMKKKGVLPS